MSSDLSASPLDRPVPVAEPAPAVVAPVVAPAVRRRERKSWREQRWERRRRRRWGEEVLAWFLVPAIVICCVWAVQATLSALGTTPSALYQQIRAIANSKS
jgi:hypothetical protein